MTTTEILQRLKDAGCLCADGWDYTKWYASPIPIELGNWEHVARVYLPLGSTLAVGNHHGGGGVSVQVMTSPNGMTIGGLAPDEWFARQEDRARDEAARIAALPPEPPYVSEEELAAVGNTADLVQLMQDAIAADDKDADESDYPTSVAADHALAVAVLFLARHTRDPQVIGQMEHLVQMYRRN